MDGTVGPTALPAEAGTVADIAPTDRGIVLRCDDGRILSPDTDSGRCTEVARTTVTVPTDVEPWCDRVQTLRPLLHGVVAGDVRMGIARVDGEW